MLSIILFLIRISADATVVVVVVVVVCVVLRFLELLRITEADMRRALRGFN